MNGSDEGSVVERVLKHFPSDESLETQRLLRFMTELSDGQWRDPKTGEVVGKAQKG